MAERGTSGSGSIGLGALLGLIIGFLLVGAPMVYYLWSTVNELLVGNIQPVQLGIAAVVLLLFLGLLSILSRSVRRLDERMH